MSAPTSRDLAVLLYDVLFGDWGLSWQIDIDNGVLSYLIGCLLLVIFCLAVFAMLMCYNFFDAIPDCVAYSHRGTKKMLLLAAFSSAATVTVGVPLFLVIHYA